MFQAKENIRKAVETKNASERQNWLSEALRSVGLFLHFDHRTTFDSIGCLSREPESLNLKNYARYAVISSSLFMLKVVVSNLRGMLSTDE
jgi:hypothetical protein